MPSKRISTAEPVSSLLPEDMLPVSSPARPGQDLHVTAAALYASLPLATTSKRGAAVYALPYQVRDVTNNACAVTPASLAAAIGPQHLASGFCFLGESPAYPLTRAEIQRMFEAAFGRAPALGDLVTVQDAQDTPFLLVHHPALGAWLGVDLYSGVFVRFE